jgi:hypothetical protein
LIEDSRREPLFHRSPEKRMKIPMTAVPLSGAHAPPEIAGTLASTGGDVEAQREARRQLMARPADPRVLDALTQLGRRVTREVTEQLVTAWNEGVAEGRSPSSFAGPVLVATGRRRRVRDNRDVDRNRDALSKLFTHIDQGSRSLASSGATGPDCEHDKRLR